jgi:hypothetical protein
MAELILCLLVLGNDPSGVPAARAEVVAEQSTDLRKLMGLQKRLELEARGLRKEIAIKSRLPASPENDLTIGFLRQYLARIEAEIAAHRKTRR